MVKSILQLELYWIQLPAGSIDDITKKTAHALQFKDGFNNLAVEIIKHIKTANRIAKQLKIEEALLHVQSFDNALKSLETNAAQKARRIYV